MTVPHIANFYESDVISASKAQSLTVSAAKLMMCTKSNYLLSPESIMRLYPCYHLRLSACPAFTLDDARLQLVVFTRIQHVEYFGLAVDRHRAK